MRFGRIGSTLATVAVLWQSFGLAQSRTAAIGPLSFEAASIRPSGPKSPRGSDGGPGSKSPTLYRYESATLQDLIVTAWNVDNFQVSSTEPIDKQSFDLEARLPEGATKEQFRTMLQSLLAERFGLKVHIESREFQAYELVVAKSGLKLKEAVAVETAASQGAKESGPCGEVGWPDLPPNRSNVSARVTFHDGNQLACIQSQMEPLSVVARFLPKQGVSTVVDRTGLTGKYSFRLEFATQMSRASADAPTIAPDVFAALQEQLGLQLAQKKLPFDVVVVDSFNKAPTDN